MYVFFIMEGIWIFFKGPGDSQLIPTALLTHFLTCLPVFDQGGSSFKPVVPGSSIGSHDLQTPRSYAR